MTRLAGSSKLLRAMNESAAFAHLLDRGMLTRADLRALTELSTPTISEALRRLTDAGLVTVVGHSSGRPGPNAEIYAVNPDAAYAAAVSLRTEAGAPAVALAICDLAGRLRARIETPTDLVRTEPATAIADILTRLREETPIPTEQIRHIQLAVPSSYNTARQLGARGYYDAAQQHEMRGSRDAAQQQGMRGSHDAAQQHGVRGSHNTAQQHGMRGSHNTAQQHGMRGSHNTTQQHGMRGSHDTTQQHGMRGFCDATRYAGEPSFGGDGVVSGIAAAISALWQPAPGGPEDPSATRVRQVDQGGALRIGVDSDVNLAAVAERRRGAGREVDGFALLWLGHDNLGLAIDIAGTLIRGARGGAGEIGCLRLYPADSPHRDLDLQSLFGGAAIVALARAHGVPGHTATDVLRAATTNPAAPFLAALADRIALGLGAVIAVLDPALVVLAGPIAQAGGETLLAAVTAAVGRTGRPESAVATTTISDDAVLLGALDAGLTAVRNDLITTIRNS